MRSTPFLRRFPQRCLSNSSNVRLTDDGPLSSFRGRSSSASSFHASLLQAIDGLVSLALCPQVVSQAPQHFRSSEKQAIRKGCFACQSICSVVSLHSGMSELPHTRHAGMYLWWSLCTLYLLAYLWWGLCTLYLLACQVRGTAGDSGLCCCVCVTSFVR